MKDRKPVKTFLSEEAPRRGRPRSEKARVKVLKAARGLLDDGGLGAVTIEALVARTGVSKPTIYRTWPNAQAVAMAALMDGPQDGAPPNRPEHDARPRERGVAALRSQLRSIVDAFSSRTGRSVTHVLAAADPSTELSRVFRNRFILTRREEGRAFLEEAIALREIGGNVDLDVALDLIYAPIFYRVLVGHAPLDVPFVEECLGVLLGGLGRKPARR
jgi:AcrR family transcriptional regulator